MSSISKWIRAHTTLVRMALMFVLLYGLPVAAFTVAYPDLAAPVVSSVSCGLTLIFVIYVFCGTTRGWRSVKDSMSASDRLREQDTPERDRIVDYTSSNILVVNSTSGEARDDVNFLKRSPEVLVALQPIEKRKSVRKSKSVKGGD